MVLGPFPSEFSYEKLKLFYSTKFEIENILFDKSAQIQGHAIIDISSFSKNMKDIISSQIASGDLRFGDDEFGVSFLPENVSLKAIRNIPTVMIDITLNKLKMAGFELPVVFEKAISLQIPLNFQFSQPSGAAITAGKTTVAFKGDLKNYLSKFDVFGATKWLEEKIVSNVAFHKSFPVPQIDTYNIELKSYKACVLGGRYLLDANVSAKLSADVINPLLAAALSSKSMLQPKVRVTLPVAKAAPL